MEITNLSGGFRLEGLKIAGTVHRIDRSLEKIQEDIILSL
jgi:hypothetical protein